MFASVLRSTRKLEFSHYKTILTTGSFGPRGLPKANSSTLIKPSDASEVAQHTLRLTHCKTIPMRRCPFPRLILARFWIQIQNAAPGQKKNQRG